jgi:excisionase family DNA binding protein
MSDKHNPDWMPDAPLLLTKQQAAALLNISVRTVGNLLRMRELVRRRIGSRCLIPKTSVEAFLRKDHQTRSLSAKSTTKSSGPSTDT